jgi:hypothetical protein
MNQKGKNNPNYRHGKYCKDYKKYCECGKIIDIRSKYCNKCRAIKNNAFKNKKHSKQSKMKIGIKSRKKWTEEYKDRIYRKKRQNKKKRAINGYILIKDYNHPNRNSHNDVLEHIKVMTKKLKRPIKKGEIIHHINYIRDDNRINNLHLYKNHSEHMGASRSLFKLVDKLLKLKIIKFKNGEYVMNKRSDVMQVGGGK